MYPLSAVPWSGSILGFTIFGGLQNTCMSTTRYLGVGRQVYIQHTFPSHVYLIHRSLKVLLCSSLRLCFGWASSREVGCGIFHCGIVWALGAFWVFEHFRFGIRGWGRISFLTHILLGFVCAALPSTLKIGVHKWPMKRNFGKRCLIMSACYVCVHG